MTIYKVTNILNGKCYIGKTKGDFQKRKKQHIQNALNGSERCPKFYNAIRKYGVDNFEWESVYSENCLIEQLNEKEKFYISKFNSIKEGYNVCVGGEGGDTLTNSPNKEERINKIRNRNVSEETRQKISNATRGKKNPFYGKKVSEEMKQKIRETKLKTIARLTIEERKKKFGSQNIGKKSWNSGTKGVFKHSEETKRKMSDSRKGLKHSEEAKRKMSLRMIGSKLSEETKRKLSVINKGENSPKFIKFTEKQKEFVKSNMNDMTIKELTNNFNKLFFTDYSITPIKRIKKELTK